MFIITHHNESLYIYMMNAGEVDMVYQRAKAVVTLVEFQQRTIYKTFYVTVYQFGTKINKYKVL
jgi:hypothetical protein